MRPNPHTVPCHPVSIANSVRGVVQWRTELAGLRAATQQLVKRETPVPVIFAFTRRSLSRALRRSAKTSCVAVLSHDGASDLFHAMLKKVRSARCPFFVTR